LRGMGMESQTLQNLGQQHMTQALGRAAPLWDVSQGMLSPAGYNAAEQGRVGATLTATAQDNAQKQYDQQQMDALLAGASARASLMGKTNTIGTPMTTTGGRGTSGYADLIASLSGAFGTPAPVSPAIPGVTRYNVSGPTSGIPTSLWPDLTDTDYNNMAMQPEMSGIADPGYAFDQSLFAGAN